MIPDDISKSSLFSALDGVRLAYFDVRLPATALVVGHEVIIIFFSLVVVWVKGEFFLKIDYCR